MKVCLLGRSDGRGGGYAAAYRLHQSLRQAGVNSNMVVGEATRGDFTVSSFDKLGKAWNKLAPSLDALPLRLYAHRERTAYSLQWLPDKLVSKIADLDPDIINLHWISAGFVKIETLAKLTKPLVWTIHDMWPFTGGCHYSQECDRYTKSCGACPQLHSHREWDISRWVWQRKAKAWKNVNLTIVSPSNWLAKCARASSLFQDLRIEVIPNGLDIQRYRAIDKQLARNLLGLPIDKKIILFGAVEATSDRRKGWHLLLPALQKLMQFELNQVGLVIFGASQPQSPPDFGFKAHYLGKLNDDISLALVYAAADVFVAPSVQDNLPNTVMEALACGTPCVTFEIGGMPDMIEHYQNGYLAQAYEVEDLAKGIAWVLEDDERHSKLCDRAHKKVEQEFSMERQAQSYWSLYQECLAKDKRL